MSKRRILLVTDGIFHPPLRGRQILHQALRQIPFFSLNHVRSLEKLPGNLNAYAALVLHYHHKAISAQALDQLRRYVMAGGGILAIHAATASFRQTPAYFEILGGQFSGHGKVERITVRPVSGLCVRNQGQGIFDGLTGFNVTDELYRHVLQPGVTVHFSAEQAGEQIPVVWTHTFGAGRVCYACPGHTSETMRNPVYQDVLRRGLRYVAQAGPQEQR